MKLVTSFGNGQIDVLRLTVIRFDYFVILLLFGLWIDMPNDQYGAKILYAYVKEQ